MSKQLIPLTVQSPGFFGLNTQQAGSILPPGWATKLDNFIFDNVGRMASRKGTQQINATVITNTPTIKSVHEYVDASGNKVNILACDNKIYKEVSGTMTDVSGTITTPTGDNWQFVNFNGWCVGFQDGHDPIVTTSATTPAFADSGGTQYAGSMGLSAYGRLWTILDNTLYYSDLLINDFTGGSSGNFDLSLYWPNGMDEAVALVDFNGYLVVFGKESIIVYENADNVDNMTIVEGIDGTGCIARDSVQAIGKDLVFLSSTGLRSLGRTVREESMPLSDISKHVRDALLSLASTETLSDIKSVYNREDGFYLLSLPTAGVSYMFDLKSPNEDGTWKVAKWTIAPTAMMYTEGLEMKVAVEDGYLSDYKNYYDGADNTGTNGSTYAIDFEGVWNDFGQEVSYMLKILKQVNVLGAGTAGSTVTFKWAVDYGSTFANRSLAFTTTPPSAYGVAQYGIDTYAASGDFERITSNLAKTGQVVKIGLLSTVDGNSFALQRIDLLAKIGKIGI